MANELQMTSAEVFRHDRADHHRHQEQGRDERGETEGRILAQARGAGGFGYDPYFESTELGRTFAEVSREEKERVSHRGRAFAKLLRLVSASRPEQ